MNINQTFPQFGCGNALHNRDFLGHQNEWVASDALVGSDSCYVDGLAQENVGCVMCMEMEWQCECGIWEKAADRQTLLWTPKKKTYDTLH